jgi:protein gp88
VGGEEAGGPMMLTQNSEMRKDRVWNWTLPAWVARRADGRAVNVCPQAGACVKVCYARNGTYNFPAVKAAHIRNLEQVTDDLSGWLTDMLNELGRRRYRPTGERRLPWLSRSHLTAAVAGMLDGGSACVRIHDSGDFLSEEYLLAWLAVASSTPDVLFYCYTKEVALLKRVASGAAPGNFLWCYSLGGRQDRLVDKDTDRHADVFPDEAAITAAGYYSQDAHDLLCVTAPSNRIGIPANNIPHFRRLMAGRTFAEMEAGARRHERSDSR